MTEQPTEYQKEVAQICDLIMHSTKFTTNWIFVALDSQAQLITCSTFDDASIVNKIFRQLSVAQPIRSIEQEMSDKQ